MQRSKRVIDINSKDEMRNLSSYIFLYFFSVGLSQDVVFKTCLHDSVFGKSFLYSSILIFFSCESGRVDKKFTFYRVEICRTKKQYKIMKN